MKLRVVQKVPHRGRRPDPVRRIAGVWATRDAAISIVSSQREEPAHRCAAAIIARAASSASAARRDVVVHPDGWSLASCVAGGRARRRSPRLSSRPSQRASNARKCSAVRPNLLRALARQHPAALQPRGQSHSGVRHRRLHKVHLRATAAPKRMRLAGVRSEPRKCRPRRARRRAPTPRRRASR